MKNSHYLLNRVFLLALCCLLINDFYLKFAYPSFLSGKLSDLAGLIVFPLFFSALFGNRFKFLVFSVAAVLFTWWKSSLSTGFIQNWNEEVAFYPLQRTIDYTDLFCLIILVPVYYYEPSKIRFMHQRAAIPVLLLGAFAIAATSKAKNLPAYNDTQTYLIEKSFKIKEVSLSEFLEYLSLSNLKFEKNGQAPSPEKPGDYHYYIVHNFQISDGFQIESMYLGVKEHNKNLKLRIHSVTLYDPPEETDKEVREQITELLDDFFAIGR